MPQLNPLSFPSQLFWLAVSFGLLYFIVSKICIPKIANVLQTRQEKIINDLDRADRLKEEAETLEKEYEDSLAATRNKANAIIAEASSKVSQAAAKKHAELDKDLDAKLKIAGDKIEAARKQAIKDISAVSVELTQDIVAKVADIKIDKKSSKMVIDNLFKDVK